jgi:CarD family transcriptional regulator
MSATFTEGDYVVYPSHGVGRLLSIETQNVAGHELKVFVISFEKNRMTLRLPMAKAQSAGLRPLSSAEEIIQAFDTLKKNYKAKKTIWARRAQEYELKINSGCLKDVAQVIRELYRDPSYTDQSYSEKLIYQSALSRLCSELALVEKIAEAEAVNKVESFLKAA